ncbi:phosphotransferase [Virgisporangium ochraceum]
MELLASGSDADVYAVSDTEVVRTYRAQVDARPETVVMRHVARHGYPVPAVHRVDGRDLWLERLHGPMMLTAVVDGTLGPGEAGATLDDLHHRLHALPPPQGTPAGERLLHLDLHPANVMMTGRGPVVIDWRNARTGPPDLDVALSALILAQVALDPDLSADLSAAAREALASFLAAVGGDPLSELDGAVARRRADRNQTPAETGRLAAAAGLVRASLP